MTIDLPHEELGGAEVSGDRLAELAEPVGVVLHADPDTSFGAGSVEVFAAPHVRTSAVSRPVRGAVRQPTPSIRSMTSSTVTAPSRRPASSHTAIASSRSLPAARPRAGRCRPARAWGRRRANGRAPCSAARAAGAARGRRRELARRGPERWLAHEDLGGDADDPVGVADLGERLRHGRGGAENDHLGRHQATCGALFVFEQAANDVGVVVVHHAEHALLIGGRHLADEVGEVVVLHLVEHTDEPVEVELRRRCGPAPLRTAPRARRRGARRPSPRRAAGVGRRAARARRRRPRPGGSRAGVRPRPASRSGASNRAGTSS